MPFEFFNTSYLAFGDRLTKAFRNLAGMLDELDESISQLEQDMAYVNNFIGRNYIVPTPSTNTSPVQGKQIFDVFSLNVCLINDISINEDGGINVEVKYFNKNSCIFTNATGSSNGMKWGWAILTPSKTNSRIDRDITFTQDLSASQRSDVLFKFYIEKNRINISEVSQYFPMFASNYGGHYKDIEVIGVSSDGKATAEGYSTFYTISDNRSWGSKFISQMTKQDGTTINIVSATFPARIIGHGIGVAYLYEGEKVINKSGTIVREIDYISGRRAT